MIVPYVNPKSKSAFLNLFADYILKLLDKESETSSRIRVTYFEQFVVVNGETSSKVVLNLIDIKKSFFEEFSDYGYNPNNFNIIDVINYSAKLYQPKIYHFTYYNSKRPIYHPEIVNFVKDSSNDSSNYYSSIYSKLFFNENLICVLNSREVMPNDIYNYSDYLSESSTFPCGYYYDDKILFYYGEYICNHLFSYLNTDRIHMKMNFNRNSEDDDYQIELFCDSIYEKEKIDSLVLDVFDFNLPKFKMEYLKDYDYNLDTTDPLGNKPWLIKDKIKDILIF